MAEARWQYETVRSNVTKIARKRKKGKHVCLCSLNHRNVVRQWWVSHGVSSGETDEQLT